MGTKVYRDIKHRKKREEQTAGTINPIKSSMDDATNVLKSFFA